MATKKPPIDISQAPSGSQARVLWMKPLVPWWKQWQPWAAIVGGLLVVLAAVWFLFLRDTRSGEDEIVAPKLAKPIPTAPPSTAPPATQPGGTTPPVTSPDPIAAGPTTTVATAALEACRAAFAKLEQNNDDLEPFRVCNPADFRTVSFELAVRGAQNYDPARVGAWELATRCVEVRNQVPNPPACAGVPPPGQ